MGIHINKKIEALTTPVKYRAYPNKKLTKILNKSMAARRHIWNWMLGLQTKYYDAIYEYSKSQVDQSVLDNLLETIQNSEDQKEVKKAKKEYNTLIKMVPVPLEVGVNTFKEIAPSASQELIDELIANHKDKTLANRMLDTLKLRKQIKFYKKQEGNEWLNFPPSDCIFNAVIATSVLLGKHFLKMKQTSEASQSLEVTEINKAFVLLIAKSIFKKVKLNYLNLV